MIRKRAKKIVHGAHDFLFAKVHRSNLIYNTCWEDPRIDRQLLELDKSSEVVMITSAGCNALDYLLDGPAAIHAVDVNPRQNALLELKQQAIAKLDFEDLAMMFGQGSHPEAKSRILPTLEDGLSEHAKDYWRRKIYYFSKPRLRKSFYYHGACGKVAWMAVTFFRSNGKLAKAANSLLEAGSLEEQQAIYEEVEGRLWNALSDFLLKQPLTMAMMGVPRAQMRIINHEYPGGIAGYIRDKVRHVLTMVPIADNYFWRVYWHGEYTPSCRPNYLLPDNQPILREHLDRVSTHTCTFTQFLRNHPGKYSHFILLDHQDWLAAHLPDELEEEWQAILDNSRPGAKVLMRSASTSIDFLPEFVKERLVIDPRAEALHKIDRVGTYGCTLFGELN